MASTNLSQYPNNPSMVATSLSTSPSRLSPSTLLTPADAPARATSPRMTPRRISSSSSLRDEHRKSAPSLKKRSSTASLRSVHNNSRTSTSPNRSTSQRSSSSSPTATTPSNLHSHAVLAKKSRISGVNEQPGATAASIAADHFWKETEHHQSSELQSQTLVVIHDACYGHRFSRPRASVRDLGSIVERPERVQAVVLGISAAYVRLAQRYDGGRFPPQPGMKLNELPSPPFQIRKTARTIALNSPAVTHIHGSKWMDDLKAMCDAAESRLALNGKELVRPPSAGKNSSANNAPALHEGDLYLCSESLNAFEGALGGVCEGIDAVFESNSTKRAFVCIRPPGHHCSSSQPSGFCWINNVHVGISYAAMTHGLTHAAILDFDLHHGDGSQEIAWDQNRKASSARKAATTRNIASHKKTAIGYFSLHDINSYPCESGDMEKVCNASVCIDKAHDQSIWNVHLEPWSTKSEFWDLYKSKYTVLIEKARAFLRLHTERLAGIPSEPSPKAAIFISAGFDASEWEGEGMQRHGVNVPTEFYAKFTADIARMAEEEGLGVEGRVISVLEGGYSNRALMTGVLGHLSGLSDVTRYQMATELDCDDGDDLTNEMTDRPDPLDISARHPSVSTAHSSEWWSPPLLDELDALVYSQVPVKPREKSAPTYFAPTQSFTAKVVPSPRDRKSTGSQASVETEAPPLPTINWATATHELFKVLIPSHRQTTSCRPEDLNAEATRLRRERQMANKSPVTSSATTSDVGRMKLRERRSKTSQPDTTVVEIPKRPTIKNGRRTTIDRASNLPDPSMEKSPNTRSTTRRKSSAMAGTPTTDQETIGNETTGPASVASMRRLSATRSVTPKGPSSPSRVPPVPRVPPAFESSPAVSGKTNATNETRSIPTSPKDIPQDDVETLTAGVRKLNIKLKVPPPEIHAARQKERERQASTATSKSNKSPKIPSGPRSLSASTKQPISRSSSALAGSQIGTLTLSAITDKALENSGADKVSIDGNQNGSSVAFPEDSPPSIASRTAP
ncbi:histone deacetylase domain-containing protein [Aspergillus avenaceus]|uniref:Histone deacetylase domain-containing protein n=1 Tax=Aspergillus avenaceus TaxID=36643 RepID=A0A5N6TPZ0_ASPAV|nr:histone deacetylase domain-containing protein [Aspergillus avenaceus]